jgi:hypothetical protein
MKAFPQMRNLYRMVLPIWIASAGFAFSAQAQMNWKMYRADYFTMKLPPGFEVKKASPVQDFQTFTVTMAGTVYATVYVGNQPTFPSLKRDGQSDVTNFKTKDVEIVSVWHDAHLLGREVLIQLNRPDGWPDSLHAWTAALPEDKLRVAEKIVSSIAVAL